MYVCTRFGHLATAALAWMRLLYAAKPVLHVCSWPDLEYNDRLTQRYGAPMVAFNGPRRLCYRFDSLG
jgi:hypothetical protein